MGNAYAHLKSGKIFATPVSQVIQEYGVSEEQIAKIEAHQTVGDFLQQSREKGVLSLPVNLLYVQDEGFVDVKDVASFLIEQEQHLKEWIDAKTFQENFLNRKIDSIQNKSKHDKRMAVKMTDDIGHVFSRMMRHRVRRCVVTDDNNNIVSLLTESAIAKFVLAHYNDFFGGGDALFFRDKINKAADSVSLREIGKRVMDDGHPLLFKHVHFVMESATVLDAIRVMTEKNISACAVLNQHGTLVHTVSDYVVRELVTEQHFRDLSLPCSEFFAKYPLLSQFEVAYETTPFKAAMQTFSVCKSYHLFVLDEKSKHAGTLSTVVGIFTLTDVIRLLADMDGSFDENLEEAIGK